MIQNSKFKIQNYLYNPSGAVMLTVVVIIIIIGLTGVAIYSLTSTSTFTQLISQNTSKAYYLAESGFRVVASEYNNTAADPNNQAKNQALENLHGTTLTLPDNSGSFDVRLYPYWFYVDSAYDPATDNSIDVRMPGGIPLRNPKDITSPRITIPRSGYLKLQGKTQLATIATSTGPTGGIITFILSPGFPYAIAADEEIFLVYSDSYTGNPQVINEGGDLVLNGSNDVAQILPARNGSFRVYNETNDIMDYTYQEKVPAVVDPGTPPTFITLSGVDHQDADDPSVFQFSIDGNSEIYFGRNLAVFTTATSGLGTTASTKTIGEYTDVGLDGGFSTGKDTISFEEDIADFIPTMNDPGGPGDPDPIEIDTVQKTIQLGGGLQSGYGSVWYKGDSDIANCIEGNCFLGRGIRAYLEFKFDDIDSSSDSTSHGDGFSFALISSSSYTDGDTGEGGQYLGYAGAASDPGLTGNGLQPPKMAVEIDTYPNSGAGNTCDVNGDSRRDDSDANHIAMVYWGQEAIGSFDATGGYLRIGAASPSPDSPEDWSSTRGTISFWFKRDTIFYGNGGSSGDRMWGQHQDMEVRFSSDGTDLILDWGSDNALTLSSHPFTMNGKWYFVAISWNEGADQLRLIYGDETGLSSQGVEWESSFSTVGITENLFMNSSGGNESRNFAVDGSGAELRYYNVARNLEDIRGDYLLRLKGDETGLQAYFPLQVDSGIANLGPNGATASTVGATAWSDNSHIAFGCSTLAATYDDNRHGAGGTVTPMNSLNQSGLGGDDGYFQIFPIDNTWLEDGLPHKLRFELIRPLSLTNDGDVDGYYDYQMKVWIDCDGCSPAEETQFEEVRSTFLATNPATTPEINLTINNGGKSLKLEQAIHDNLKQILFGFTQGTGGARQNITLSNFELYFLKRYPVSDLSSW